MKNEKFEGKYNDSSFESSQSNIEEKTIKKPEINKNKKITKSRTTDALPLIHNLLSTSTQKKVFSKFIRKNTSVPKKLNSEMELISIKEFPKFKYFKDELIQKILKIIYKENSKRTKEEISELYSFFVYSRIIDKLKSDFLYTNYTPKQLVELISQFISFQIYDKNDIIYTIEEKAEMIYIILRGNVGLYQIEVSEEQMSYEEYLLYLYRQKKLYDINQNSVLEDDNKEKQFIDDYLLKNMIEKNKDIYRIKNFSDIDFFLDIIFLIYLFKDCHDNEGQNLIELYSKFNYSHNTYNYHKFLNGEISFNEFKSYISSLMNEKEYYYMNNLIPLENNIKTLKYIRVHYLNESDYFGNFEIINTKPLRDETAKCESQKILLLAINKKVYASLINENLKNVRIKELNYFHKAFFFRVTNKSYFKSNIYSQFKMKSYRLGEELFKENDKLDNFYLIKEGILEISINNSSILELKELIYKLYNLIQKDIKIDFTLKNNRIYSNEIINQSLNKKRKYLIYTCQRDIFGDYELYYQCPSIFTATVISKDVKLFSFPFKNYIEACKDISKLRNSLKESAKNKIQYIIERLANVYNSHFNEIEKEIKRKHSEYLFEQEKFILSPTRKNTSSISLSPDELKILYKNVKNTGNYKDYNNDLLNDLKSYGPKIENENNKKLQRENSFLKEKKLEDEEVHFYNKKKTLVFSNNTISNKNDKNNSLSTGKEYSKDISNLNLDTSIKSTNLNRIYEKNKIFCKIRIKKPKKYFLPPISTSINNNSINSISIKKNNDNNTNEVSFNDKTLNNSNSQNSMTSILPFSSRNKKPIFIELNKKKIKVPLRIEKNVPLINKLKMQIQESNNFNNLKKKLINKKIIFKTIIKGNPSLKTINKSIGKTIENSIHSEI